MSFFLWIFVEFWSNSLSHYLQTAHWPHYNLWWRSSVCGQEILCSFSLVDVWKAMQLKEFLICLLFQGERRLDIISAPRPLCCSFFSQQCRHWALCEAGSLVPNVGQSYFLPLPLSNICTSKTPICDCSCTPLSLSCSGFQRLRGRWDPKRHVWMSGDLRTETLSQRRVE